jgi:signal transduction histidine kinase
VTAADVERPLEPLWRGLLVYRVLTLVSAGAVLLWSLGDYARPAAAVAVLAAMVGWTALTGAGYLAGLPGTPDGRGRIAVADLVVTVGVVATTPLVQTPAQLAADAPVMGSIWTPGAVLACALAFGVRGALLAAAVLAGALVAFQARVENELGDIQLVVLVALTVGFASTVLRRSAERLRRAVAAEAAARERERLARAVHDGVLQVLGLLRRRGAELAGSAAPAGELGRLAGEMGRLAGEQEVALRTLLTTGSASVDDQGRRDLAAALRTLASPRVTVSTAAGTVELPAAVVDELVAAVAEALQNTARHAGPDARAWVLLEEVGDGVEISVRDDGPGIPAGRLAEAAAQGRMGVARSIHGRVADLGGAVTCDTGPDRGTEWTIRLGTS